MFGTLIKKLFLTLQIATNLPVDRIYRFEDKKSLKMSDLNGSGILLPLAGAVVGILAVVAAYVLMTVGMGKHITPAILVSLLVLIADINGFASLALCGEAFFKGRDLSKIDERPFKAGDGNTKIYGLTVAMLPVIVVYSGFAELCDMRYLPVYFLMPVYARICILVLSFNTIFFENDDEPVTLIAHGLTGGQMSAAFIFTLLMSLSCPFLCIVLVVNVLATVLMRVLFISRSGYISGKVLQASVIINYCVFLTTTVFFKIFIF